MFLFTDISKNKCFTKVLQVNKFCFLFFQILGPEYIEQDPKFLSNMD